jgi:oxepin-CoA hydrolase/3-oxo-5,6-dehydrosuberyl-CoA semialdehyde dehydrogenase
VTEVLLGAGVLPPGVLQFLAGSAGDLIDRLGPQDVLAFTGSGATGAMLRAKKNVIEHAVRVNVEADSLNAAVLGADAAPGSETWQLFLTDVARDITQKTGQKCTAIRRVLVPAGRQTDVLDAMRERLGAIAVGDPAREDVRMGPLATAQQLRDVREGIARLAAATTEGYGGTGELEPIGVPKGTGYFVGPIVRVTPAPMDCAPPHDHELFGPVVTVGPSAGDPARAAAFIARGAGCLVSSAYSDDRDWVAGFVGSAAAWTGRLYLGSSKMAAQSPGPGTVLPSLVHGGPGRAGGGEEVGGIVGLRPYLQRVAVQGSKPLLDELAGVVPGVAGGEVR